VKKNGMEWVLVVRWTMDDGMRDEGRKESDNSKWELDRLVLWTG
jgi:hypothetical protein